LSISHGHIGDLDSTDPVKQTVNLALPSEKAQEANI